MIVFGGGLRFDVFYLEIANVIHHASIWSALEHAAVEVLPAPERPDYNGAAYVWDLSVQLEPDRGGPTKLALLAGYLSRILPAQYSVIVDDDRVRVEWDARRPCRAMSAAASPDAPP